MKRFVFILLTLGWFVSISQPSQKKLKAHLDKARIDWGVPGMSVAIVYNGDMFLNEGFGVKNILSKEAVDHETQYAIASNTKAFVSAAIATLVSENKISWNDPVRKYLPNFSLYDDYASNHITIADLLCHRAGLGTFSGDVIWYKSEKSASELIPQIQYVPQAYEFRAGYGYSNLMFITAGEIIQAVTGMSWNDYVAKTFFQPLRMNETVTSTSDLLDNAATPHKPNGEINQPIAWVNWDNMGAAGGIISSVDDMSQWIKLLLNQGITVDGDTIIDPDQLTLMWTPHNNFPIYERSKLEVPGRNFNGYGLGWGVYDYFGRKVITHSGGYDGMYSRVVLVPEEKLGFVVLTNSMTGIITPMMFDLINQFIKEDNRDWHAKYLNRSGADAVSQRKKELQDARQSETTTQVIIESLVGDYHDPMYGTISIQENNGTLRLTFEKAPKLAASLEHWHHDTWEIKWDEIHAWFDFGLLSFIIDPSNQVTGIEFEVPNYDIFFDEIHAKKR